MKRAIPTILVVDDDPDDLMLIETAFRTVGVGSKIQTVGGGDEAIAYLTAEGKFSDRSVYGYPDFVVSDLKMPGVNGFGLLKFLKADPARAMIPTFILSASLDDDDIKQSYLLGANSYHVKPGAQSALRALVKALHDYWMVCELPETDGSGKPFESTSRHKLGEHYRHRAQEAETDETK